ncbi:hypothetical protein [Saccharothrix coeruleofusca]|nr:hypothetical protein [Saccharothrix coeruleofusca]MBP2334345.1 hypothetical protein [Saccharothrix coeruleofusca]
MSHLELHLKLPPDLPPQHYDGIRHAVASLLELWGVPGVCPLLIGVVGQVCVCEAELERCG